MSRQRASTLPGAHTEHKFHSPSTHPSVNNGLPPTKPDLPPHPSSSADVRTSTPQPQPQPEAEVTANANAEQPAESHNQGSRDGERDESFQERQKQEKETRQELIAHIVKFNRRRVEKEQRRERFERARSFEDDDEWITETPWGWVYTPATTPAATSAPVSTNEVPPRTPVIPFARPVWRERYTEE
ncbi:hypothetical protein ANO14919_023120 [Xylariales sp. No.14919]|nr:hypothetical protein ANO14919_023120 [Xylariales sp. No.14919]